MGLHGPPRRLRRLGAQRAPAGQPGRHHRVEHRQALPARARRGRPAGHPHRFVEPGDAVDAAADGEWVVKPTISAASQDTGRYRLRREAAWRSRTCAACTAAGRTAMIQPYLTAVDTAARPRCCAPRTPTGELSFSHAIRKGPMLTGPDIGARLRVHRGDQRSDSDGRRAGGRGPRRGGGSGRSRAAALRAGGHDPGARTASRSCSSSNSPSPACSSALDRTPQPGWPTRSWQGSNSRSGFFATVGGGYGPSLPRGPVAGIQSLALLTGCPHPASVVRTHPHPLPWSPVAWSSPDPA